MHNMHEQPSSPQQIKSVEQLLEKCVNTQCSAFGRPRLKTTSGKCPACSKTLEIIKDAKPPERKAKPTLDLSVIKSPLQISIINMVKEGVVDLKEIALRLGPPYNYGSVMNALNKIYEKLEIDGGLAELIGLITPEEKKPEDYIGLETKLNPEQLKIVRLTLEGFSRKEIAENFGVSAGTIRSRLKEIYDLTGGKDHLGLARLAASEGL
jgi:DNA-binding CsgD family transcriptional regulator